MNKFILILCLISQIAICDTDPHFEVRGFVLTQDSWVFSPDKAKSVRDKLIDGDTYFKLNESLSKSIDLYKANDTISENKISLLLEQNDKLAKNLMAERTVGNWEKFGYFVVGIVATCLAGWAIGQVHR